MFIAHNYNHSQVDKCSDHVVSQVALCIINQCTSFINIIRKPKCLSGVWPHPLLNHFGFLVMPWIYKDIRLMFKKLKTEIQVVMGHGHVTIQYVYVYHIVHTTCCSMWYATNHSIIIRIYYSHILGGWWVLCTLYMDSLLIY